MTTEDALFILDHGASMTRACASLCMPAPSDGLAVFEDMRCYRNAKTNATYVFRLDEHVKRLMRSMGLAMMDAPCTAKKLSNAVVSAVLQSGLVECRVRMTAYRARPLNAPGGNPLARIAIACEGVQADSDMPAAKAVVSSWRAIPVDSLPQAMRCVAASSVFALARQEAVSCGASEAVLLNGAGLVCQSTCGSVMVMRDGVLSTPPSSSGAYESVMRDTVLNLAMDMDVPSIEEQLTRADLAIADEAFFADDVLGIVPLARIDGRQVGRGKPGAITEALQKRFAKASMSELDDYSSWLTEIR